MKTGELSLSGALNERIVIVGLTSLLCIDKMGELAKFKHIATRLEVTGMKSSSGRYSRCLHSCSYHTF